MRHGNLTREQAIKQAGIDAVEAIEKENCDFTNRVDQELDFEDVVEFSSSIEFIDAEGINRTLTMYYYPDAEQINSYDGDFGKVDWDCVEGFEIN